MTKTFAFVLCPGITPLDLVGPLQVLSALAQIDPSFAVVVVGQDLVALDTETPLKLTPSHTFDQFSEPFALIVPGGCEPTLEAPANESLLDWIRRAARTAEVVGSVCTGSLILGAAGLLDGRQATTHWGYPRQERESACRTNLRRGGSRGSRCAVYSNARLRALSSPNNRLPGLSANARAAARVRPHLKLEERRVRVHH
jgi:transcriptional regulator GlxA family with amidase domain